MTLILDVGMNVYPVEDLAHFTRDEATVGQPNIL